MNKPDPVVGCSTCGALYTPVPGDRGHCAACSSLLLDEPPAAAADPGGASGYPLPGEPNREGRGQQFRATAGARPTNAPRAHRGKGRSLRRIAIGFVALMLAGALGAAFRFRRHDVAEIWSAVQRREPREAWTAARHLASDGWSAIRRRLPFAAPQAEQSASTPSAKPSRVAVRGGTPARRTHQKAVAKE